MADTHLTIPESLILLALNEETGERKGNFLNYALIGAALRGEGAAGRSGIRSRRVRIGPSRGASIWCLDILTGARDLRV